MTLGNDDSANDSTKVDSKQTISSSLRVVELEGLWDAEGPPPAFLIRGCTAIFHTL